jgi:hypothetical protein
MTENTTMTTPAPATEDHRGRLRALLVECGEFVAALDEIARTDDRRLTDVTRQIRAWRRQLGTVLDTIGVTPSAAGIAAEIRAETGKIPSPFEVAARIIERGQHHQTSAQ